MPLYCWTMGRCPMGKSRDLQPPERSVLRMMAMRRSDKIRQRSPGRSCDRHCCQDRERRIVLGSRDRGVRLNCLKIHCWHRPPLGPGECSERGRANRINGSHQSACLAPDILHRSTMDRQGSASLRGRSRLAKGRYGCSEGEDEEGGHRAVDFHS